MSFRQKSQQYTGYLNDRGQVSLILSACKTRQYVFKTGLYLLPGLLRGDGNSSISLRGRQWNGNRLPPWKGGSGVCSHHRSQGTAMPVVAQLWGKLCLFLTREGGGVCTEMCAMNLGRQLLWQRDIGWGER